MDHMRLAGTLRRPDHERIRELAGPLHLSPTEAELSTFERLIDKALDMFDVIDTLPPVEPVRLYPHRPAGRSPHPGEDPLNAYITICDVPARQTARSRSAGLQGSDRSHWQAGH